MLQDLGSPLGPRHCWTVYVTAARHARQRPTGSGLCWPAASTASARTRFSSRGVAHSLLHQYGQHETLTRRQVLAAAALEPVKPRLQLLVDDSFNPSGEWAEIATRIEAKHHVKHGLFGNWPESIYVKRYRHRFLLGWTVVLARHVDLMHPEGKWWLVLDAKGHR